MSVKSRDHAGGRRVDRAHRRRSFGVERRSHSVIGPKRWRSSERVDSNRQGDCTASVAENRLKPNCVQLLNPSLLQMSSRVS
jgi:hypothetical protein